MKMIYETHRLFMKVLHADAAEKVLEFYEKNRDFLEPWEPDRVPRFYTLDFQRTQLNFEYNQMIHGHSLRLWIMTKEEPERIIGCVCFNNIIRGAFMSCVAGYKIAQEYCCQGYGSEAMNRALHIMFEDYHMHRVEAYVMDCNVASIRLLNKLNFRMEGTAASSVRLKGEWMDHLRFALIANEHRNIHIDSYF